MLVSNVNADNLIRECYLITLRVGRYQGGLQKFNTITREGSPKNWNFLSVGAPKITEKTRGATKKFVKGGALNLFWITWQNPPLPPSEYLISIA